LVSSAAVFRIVDGPSAPNHRHIQFAVFGAAHGHDAAISIEISLGALHAPTALEFARRGDTLIVRKLDRLARSMKQLIETIENLRVRGIGFHSLTEALDTTTAQRRLVFHMFGALAEFERSLIRERTQAGLAAARRAGRTGGRPPELTDDDIEAAKALLANPDIGVTQIVRRLGFSLSVHSRRTNRQSPWRVRKRRLYQSSAADLG
jgi:DNA invertase Pin-like site-specific DNA recombinase